MVTRLVGGLGGMAAGGSSKGGLYLCNWERVKTWLQEPSFKQSACSYPTTAASTTTTATATKGGHKTGR